jgi:hypothetical protein
MFEECPFMDLMPWPALWMPTEDATYVKEPFFTDNPRRLIELG